MPTSKYKVTLLVEGEEKDIWRISSAYLGGNIKILTSEIKEIEECKCKKCGCDKKETTGWIYERNPDTEEVFRRRSVDTTPVGMIPREKISWPGPSKALKTRVKENQERLKEKEYLIKEYMSMKGGDFNKWWSSLPEAHKLIITKEFNFS